MSKKLGITILFVEDLEKSKDFYVNKLGLEIMADLSSYGFVSFKLDGASSFALQDIKIHEGDYQGRPGSAEVGFEVDNVEEIWQELKNKDVKISEIEKKPFGRVFYLKDLEGHNISIYQTPSQQQ